MHPTRALIFDSIYDDYRGVIVYFRVFDGELRKGQKIRFMGTDKEYQITELGKLMPRPKQVETIGTGEVGYIVAAIKDLHDVRIGDTVTDAQNPAAEPLPGYKPIQQMVFCDFYPGGEDAIRRAARRDGPPAAQRLLASPSSPRAPMPWASASAAGSSACCTWRSSRSGSSASSTSRWSRPRRPSPTRSR